MDARQVEEISFPRWLFYARWISLLSSLALLIYFVGRGFDLTDESFYIAWTVNPAGYDATIHPFGYPLHLLYLGVGQSLIAMRLVGIGLLTGSGALVGYSLWRFYRGNLLPADRHGLPLIGALTSLLFYAFWILTPGYNLLVNAGAALVFAGALLWATRDRDRDTRVDLFATSLVALGGTLCAFAKPTFGALAGGAMLVLLASTWRAVGPRTALSRLAIALVSCTALCVLVLELTLGTSAFFETLERGAKVLNFGNAPHELLQKSARDIYYSSPVLWITSTFFFLSLCLRREFNDGGVPNAVRQGAWVVAALNLIFFVSNVDHGIWTGRTPFAFVGIASICLAMSLLTLGMISSRGRTDCSANMAPIIILLVLPFAMSFGSAISIMTQTGMYLWAPVMALIVGTRLTAPKNIMVFSEACALAFVPLVLAWSSMAPFHLPASMFLQTEKIRVPFSSDTLRVDRETKKYLSGLQEAARIGALTPETPVMDLSGAGPGTVLALGGRAPYYPWLYHLHGDPVPAADAAWASLSPEQKLEAWVIGPIAPQFARAQVTKDLAAQRQMYQPVAKLDVRFWGGGYKPVEIWKPR